MLFTDETSETSLAEFLKDVELMRTLMMFDPADADHYQAQMIEWEFSMAEWQKVFNGWQATDGVFDLPQPALPFPLMQTGNLIGISSTAADEMLNPLIGSYIDFFDGYDESIFRSGEYVCVVNETVFSGLDSDAPVLPVAVQAADGKYVSAELRVVGIVYGTGNTVYCPFWTAAELGYKSDGEQTYTEVMNAFISDNRLIDEFKAAARGHFVTAGVIDNKRPFALMIFDGLFNDIVKNLRQNIRLIDIATPFIYSLSVCIGFVASFLLTRRRKPEFAIMRSIGISKQDVFFGALAEQIVLCLAGAAAGFLLTFIFLGYAMPVPPVLFTACYVLGCAFSAIRAAGADVLILLARRE